MTGAHSHGAGQDRTPPRRDQTRRLAITLALVLLYMAAEVAGGILADSLALLADAGHMLSDAGALGLTLFAMWFARRPPTARHTFGFYRAEILAALVNATTLVTIAVFIFWEAWGRLREPPDVHGALLTGVATGGLVVNLAGLWLLHGGRAGNLNVRGAWLHVLGDTLGSVQAIVAGALILAYGWTWADPVASVLIGLLVVRASWSLLREAVAVLMESAPSHVDVDAVRDRLLDLPGASHVRDLHVWTISSGLVALSAHVAADRPPAAALDALRRDLAERFHIQHSTIEFDPPGDPGHRPLPL